MSFDHLFENQPRWAEVLAGVVALLAGIFALGFAIWLYDRDVLTGRDVAARPIALITVLVPATPTALDGGLGNNSQVHSASGEAPAHSLPGSLSSPGRVLVLVNVFVRLVWDYTDGFRNRQAAASADPERPHQASAKAASAT